jgi:hypothetical protein
LLHRSNGRGTLVVAGRALLGLWGDRSTERGSSFGTGTEGLGPVEAFACWSPRCVRSLILS